MSWKRRGSQLGPAAAEQDLDRLLSQFEVEVPDSLVEEICHQLHGLPSNQDWLRKQGRPLSLFWPGLGLACGMLMLGLIVGADEGALPFLDSTRRLLSAT